MDEIKERARIENPDLYHFAYIREDTAPQVPSHLNFAQIDSYWKNWYYTVHKKVEHHFEQKQFQLAEIPWRDVPIPEPKMNIKLRSKKSRNQIKKESNTFNLVQSFQSGPCEQNCAPS